MCLFSNKKSGTAGYQLALFHIVVIASSNYLVQLPCVLFGFTTTWGAFTFPFIFLATDLTIRIFGATLARKIIFIAMFPALIVSYLMSVLFLDGEWLGFSVLWVKNSVIARIALASFSAYLVGQIMDITIFNYLRRSSCWWLAPSVSAIFGNMVDTIVFFSIAFYHSDNVFMASHWIEIAMVDYSVKILACGLFFLPLYGVILNFLLNKLTMINTESRG